TAAEQPRETLLQSGVDAIERVLEARTRLAIDLADRRFQRFERFGEILELAIEVFLALGLFLELVDRSQIHLAEPLDLLRQLRERLLPCTDLRFRRHLLVEGRQIELRRLELFEQRLAPHL